MLIGLHLYLVNELSGAQSDISHMCRKSNTVQYLPYCLTSVRGIPYIFSIQKFISQLRDWHNGLYNDVLNFLQPKIMAPCLWSYFRFFTQAPTQFSQFSDCECFFSFSLSSSSLLTVKIPRSDCSLSLDGRIWYQSKLKTWI